MNSASAASVSPAAERILRALKRDRCVLVTGPPGTGKSRVINEVREAFKSLGSPVSQPGANVPIPKSSVVPSTLIPSPTKKKRDVFQTELHQNSRFRQFWRDLEPSVATPGGFRISQGLLYLANEHALDPDGAALAIIEEGSRGPLVQVLGPSLTALEGDKRLSDDGKPAPNTAEFQLPDDAGDLIRYRLSAHLYVLIAQNNADTSVEVMDVALGRRFARIALRPDLDVLHDFFGIAASPDPPPETPATAEDVYVAAARALAAINRRISVGRGHDFEIGHGVFMRTDLPPPPSSGSYMDALDYLQRRWERVEAHVDEVFHGQPEQIGAALGTEEPVAHPYEVVYEDFGNVPVGRLERGLDTAGNNLYGIMRAVGGP